MKMYKEILVLMAFSALSCGTNNSGSDPLSPLQQEQPGTMLSAMDTIKLYYEKFESHFFHNDHYDYDSLLHYRSLFKATLRKALEHEATSVLQELEAAASHLPGLKIYASRDRQLYIINWDDQEGGTMRSFEGFYVFNDGSRYVVQELGEEDQGGSPGYYGLYQVTTAGGTPVYIALSVSIGSGALSYHTVQTITIDNGRLNTNASYIATSKDLISEIGYEADWAAATNRNSNLERSVVQLTYDETQQAFFIPLITADGTITDRKLKYQFNGQYFVYVK